MYVQCLKGHLNFKGSSLCKLSDVGNQHGYKGKEKIIHLTLFSFSLSLIPFKSSLNAVIPQKQFRIYGIFI